MWQSSKKSVLINGYFLCRRLTGIERFAFEITKRLDKISLPAEISIIVPGNCSNVPDYKNIKIIRMPKEGSGFNKIKKKFPHLLWQFLVLQSFLLTRRQFIILDFGNTCLPFSPGIIFLHDIYCELFPQDFSTLRDKAARLYNRWQYRLIARSAKKIVTVSNFSKNQIIRYLRADPRKISVVYNSWDHFSRIKADYSVFSDFPVLSKPFYFSLGSLSKRKNIKWIVDYAQKHPDDIFALSGEALSVTNAVNGLKSILPNVIFLGYLSDSKVKALMEKCKAFIHPSRCEGFGIPPMEALSCGAKIIISNVSSLPEIYGDSAYYIDPQDTDIDLDELLKQPVSSPDKVLEKYSYDASAQQVYSIIREII